MKAVRIARADDPSRLEGLVLGHELRDARGATIFAKGSVLGANDVAAALALPWDAVHGVMMDAGDVHEDEAGDRLARAAAGVGVETRAASAGAWPLVAAHGGLVDVSLDALHRVNAIEGLCVYTLFDGQVVTSGEVVARAKIIPFAIDGQSLAAGVAIALDAKALVRVRPFIPMQVGVVVQESLGERAMARFRSAFTEKIEWFGSTLLEPEHVPPEATAVAGAIGRLIAAGAQVITIAGTRAMDPLDATFLALNKVGARMERHGVPAHPGSLFWLAYLGSVPVIGMPGCGLFSQATVLDLVLPRVLVGERVGRAWLAELGHGGFLTREMAFRFPPYRATAGRGEAGDS